MTRAPRQDSEIRREEIIEAAARVFARKGLRSARMSDIAEEANLSAGAIYRYFPGKEELMRARFEDAVSKHLQLIEDESEFGPTPLAALERIGRRLLVDLDDWDALMCELQMTMEAARDPEGFGVDLARSRQEVRQIIGAKIQQAQDAGEISRDVDPITLATLLHATCSGLQMLKLDPEDDIDSGAIVDLLVQMVAGITPIATDSDER